MYRFNESIDYWLIFLVLSALIVKREPVSFAKIHANEIDDPAQIN